MGGTKSPHKIAAVRQSGRIRDHKAALLTSIPSRDSFLRFVRWKTSGLADGGARKTDQYLRSQCAGICLEAARNDVLTVSRRRSLKNTY